MLAARHDDDDDDDDDDIYKQDMTYDSLQVLIYHKTQPSNQPIQIQISSVKRLLYSRTICPRKDYGICKFRECFSCFSFLI